MSSFPFSEVKLTSEQTKQIDIALIATMNAAPFFAQILYSIGRLKYTEDIPTLATDGRHVIINPTYFCGLKVSEQVFAICHEMHHFVSLHPQRFKHYGKAGELRGLPWVPAFGNVCADYVINSDLLRSMGADVSINPDWLYDRTITGDELWEDLYVKHFPPPPPPPPPPKSKPKPGEGSAGGQDAQQPGQQDAPDLPDPKTWGSSGKGIKGVKGDPTARAQGGSFDQVLDPPVDPVTGETDLPEEHEYKEAIVRAAGVARAMGKLPASMQRMVEELLAHQVDWREHIRQLVVGKVGSRGETWARPNRRRLALNPIVVMPGKRGYGSELVVVAVDTSGSIGEKELSTFFSEVGGILDDCKPHKIIVIGCDARVTQVDEVSSLSEFEGLRQKGIKGGGGTSFVPVFEYCEEHNLKPETLVYLSDGYGSWPDEAPAYPVVWTLTTDVEPPFGEAVRIEIKE